MTILAIDTASNFCACGIYDQDKGRLIASRTDDIGRGHAEHLMGQVGAVLEEASLTLQDVTALGVCVGPGSFTGIRVGVAATRGFALALGIEASGVSTLQAIAADVVSDHEPGSAFAVTLKAGRDQLYVQLFDATGAAIGQPIMTVLNELHSELPTDIALIAGNAAELLQGHGYTMVETTATGRIETIARLSLDSPLAPSPLYLRGADAKVQTGFAIARAGAGGVS